MAFAPYVRGDDRRRRSLWVISDPGPLDTPCWLWQGSTVKGGYGIVSAHRRRMLAHRWSYEMDHGPIPEGLEVDHLCNRPACINPEHLEAVTQAENNRRKAERRTHCKHGHPYDEANTYHMPGGGRDCRTCINARSKRHKARQAVTL